MHASGPYICMLAEKPDLRRGMPGIPISADSKLLITNCMCHTYFTPVWTLKAQSAAVLARRRCQQRQCLMRLWPAVRAGQAVLYGWIEAVREHLQDSIPDEAAHATLDSEVAANLQLQVACQRLHQCVRDVRTQHAPMKVLLQALHSLLARIVIRA